MKKTSVEVKAFKLSGIVNFRYSISVISYTNRHLSLLLKPVGKSPSARLCLN